MSGPELKKDEPKPELLHTEEPDMFTVEGMKLPQLKKLLEQKNNENAMAEEEFELLQKENSALVEAETKQQILLNQAEENFDGTPKLTKAMELAKDKLTQTEILLSENSKSISKVKTLLTLIGKEKQQITERITDIESFKEETLFEFTYTLAGNKKDKLPAKLVKTYEGVVIEYNGNRINLNLDTPTLTLPEIYKGYETASSPRMGQLAYVLLQLNVQQGRAKDSTILFEDSGTQGVARFEIHNDGPGGPLPFDHPGIGIYIKKKQ